MCYNFSNQTRRRWLSPWLDCSCINLASTSSVPTTRLHFIVGYKELPCSHLNGNLRKRLCLGPRWCLQKIEKHIHTGNKSQQHEEGKDNPVGCHVSSMLAHQCHHTISQSELGSSTSMTHLSLSSENIKISVYSCM